MLLAVHYQVMVQAGSLENTLEARVALGYRPEQLLPFFCVLQTLHVYHNLLVYINAQDNCSKIMALKSNNLS